MKIKTIHKKIYVLTLLMFCLSNPMQAMAVMKWQPAPIKHKAGMNHNRMAAKNFQLIEHHDTKVFLWKPDLKSKLLELDNDQLKLHPTGMDNYHALVAKRRTDKVTEVAIRYQYMRGKPSGVSPRVLTSGVKASYEITPAPLPREHRRYQAAHDVVFILRYEGEPVSNTPVILSTTNGTTLRTTSGRAGAFRFTLPDDFAETKPGRRNNKPAEFVLFSEHSVKGRNYRTSLSAAYYVDPAHWKSTELGALVLVFGFVSGVVITWRDHKSSSATKGRNS